jgi:DNA-binding transcriptional MocR family regulator
MYPAEKFIPNCYRLETHLRKNIRSGVLKPGDPVPSESQIWQRFLRQSNDRPSRFGAFGIRGFHRAAPGAEQLHGAAAWSARRAAGKTHTLR